MNRQKKSSRPPNLKEFVRYLNKTIDMFDHHIPESEFENTESKVHQLFYSLFNIYLENHPITIESESRTRGGKYDHHVSYPTLPEIESMIHQHYNKEKTSLIPEVPNKRTVQRLERPDDLVENSDVIARRIYRESLLDLQSSEEKPYQQSVIPIQQTKPERSTRIERPEKTKKKKLSSSDNASESEAITHIPPVMKPKKRSKSFKEPKHHNSRENDWDWSPVKSRKVLDHNSKAMTFDDEIFSPSPPPKSRAKKKIRSISPVNYDEDTETLDKRIEALRKLLKEF
jgi:hypothetical protein